jgi:hypothetical protein
VDSFAPPGVSPDGDRWAAVPALGAALVIVRSTLGTAWKQPLASAATIARTTRIA